MISKSKTQYLMDTIDQALDAFWQPVARRFPTATTGDLSPGTSMDLDAAAEEAIAEWVYFNVVCPQFSVADDSPLDATLRALFNELNDNFMGLPKRACFVSVSDDLQRIFTCPMLENGCPQLSGESGPHPDWKEVLAPDAEFLREINQIYGTAFTVEQFSGT